MSEPSLTKSEQSEKESMLTIALEEASKEIDTLKSDNRNLREQLKGIPAHGIIPHTQLRQAQNLAAQRKAEAERAKEMEAKWRNEAAITKRELRIALEKIETLEKELKEMQKEEPK